MVIIIELYDLNRNERLTELIKEPSRPMHSYSKSVFKTNPDIGFKKLREEKEENYYHYTNTNAVTTTNPNVNVVLPIINKETQSQMKIRKRKMFNNQQEDCENNLIVNYINKVNENDESNNITPSFLIPRSKNNFRKRNKFPTHGTFCNNINIFQTQELSTNHSPQNNLFYIKNKNYRNPIRDPAQKIGERLQLNVLSPNKHRLTLIDDTLRLTNSNSPLITSPESPIINLIESQLKLTKDLPNENDEEIFTMKKYHCLSQAGKNSKGITKINQDAYLDCPSLYDNKEINLFGVFDGHGANGHFISQFVVNYIKEYFKLDQTLQKAKTTKEIYQILIENHYEKIKSAFISAEKALLNYSNEIDGNYSGTTCVLVFQIGNKIICANVGDSRAIMMKERKTIIPLSTDHKPELEEEKKRILSNGGEIAKDEEYGPFRVWAKGQNAPGIAMSRSIGDFLASSLGVIPLPEVKEFTLDDECKYIIMASDGIWEFLSNERVEHLSRKFYKYNNADKICESLVEKATKKWEKEDEVVDDITVISILF